MKIIIYFINLLTLVFLCSCNNTKEIKNDLEIENLHGNVKSIKEITYYAELKFGEIVKGAKYIDELNVNTLNNLNSENNYTEYNKNGYLIKSFTPFKYIFKYNKNNKLIKKYYYSDDFKNFNLEIYQYNELGFLSECDEYLSVNLDSLISKTKYQYDDMGNQTESNRFAQSGKLNAKTKYFYKNNNIENIKGYDGEGNFMFHSQFFYDKNCNEIECDFIDENGIPFEKIKSKYDDNNLIIEQIELLDKTKKSTSYKYKKFDKNNNWTEKLELQNGTPKFFVERKIMYYN